MPDSQSTEQWSAEAKLAVVAETLAFSEVELSEYCRKNSLFPEQVKFWKDVFLNSQRPAAKPSKAELKAAADAVEKLAPIFKPIETFSSQLALLLSASDVVSI